ncbi:hypothetical protein Htur_0086 [Haloterrigena turkmenica DSM 5511]|uniref:Uncharacterized protein n=1 Tax=Haloterrigena turkmenica (strain ATCC 51198 / DSM 5511 / JCM 9101 / NCIMB 13204 / VKM B-1734 / 4k) TaxID=543526 RepID=D2RTE4_HALTV|nr:hypothetical protein [Haloterrigena turkmenica]ADB58987.1 hypothetical protein Htur_0086 [Haloterrigena turkmenica DSM 5511]
MSGIQRRRLLAATGVGLTGAIAGCLGSDETDGANGDENGDEDGNENETETEDDEIAESVSGTIVVDNLDDASHTFDILIEYDGQIQHWETRSPGADETLSFDHSWSVDREQFRVTARLNGGEPVNITPSNWNESSCLSIFVRITDGETMTYSSNTDPGHCESTTDDESE